MVDQWIEFLRQYPWWFFCGLHLTLGRSASVIYAISLNLHPSIYAPLAFFWDCAQVPLWWWLYTAAARQTLNVRGVGAWIEKREERAEHRRLWQRLGALGDVGVVLLAALPFWGCGMWTSTLLAWTIGMRLSRAIWHLAFGGLVGLILLMLIGYGVKSLLV